MKISTVAGKCGVPAKTIRYYEQAGLLRPAKRGINGYRFYQNIDVERLIFIRRCRELDMSLDHIKALLEVKQNPEASCSGVDKMLAEQLERVRQRQKELAELEQSLSEMVSGCCSDQIKDCGILKKLQS